MRLSSFYFALLFFYCLFHATSGKRKLKILVNNPGHGWSHMQFHGKLADLLVEAGHEVHMLIQDFNPYLANYTGANNQRVKVTRVPRLPEKRDDFLKIDFIDNAFNGVNNMLTDGTMDALTGIWSDACGECHYLFQHFGITKLMKRSPNQEISTLGNAQPPMCRIPIDRSFQLELPGTCTFGERDKTGFPELLDTHQQLIKQLTKEQYDVGISEYIDLCRFGIFHKIGVHTKLATSTFMVGTDVSSLLGLPTISSYVPNLWAPSISAPYMGFYERARNFFMNVLQFKVYSSIYSPELMQHHFTRAYGQNFPLLSDIMKNISLAFFNTNEFLDLPRPISNKIVYVGGVVEGKTKNLTQDFQTIMDKSKRGVVLFSFGSLADTKLLDPKIKEAFFKSFASFPEYEFIWKLELTANQSWMQSIAPNVHLFDWFDQRSILAHPKTVAFITHCGMNSLNEGARAGVPLIGIPLFADQLYDAAAMKHKNFGVYVDILETHKQEVITSALDQVLNNPAYSYNAKLIQKKLNNAPFSPSERFVKWLEFAAEFPDFNELQLPSPDEIGILSYYSLDVIGTTICCAILLALTLFYFVRRILNMLWRFNDHKKVE